MAEKDTKILLGIDWGIKRIGVAEADSSTRLAVPVSTLESLQKLKEMIISEEADVLVVGCPISMSGEKDFSRSLFPQFVKKLKKEFPNKEVILFDERLTSKKADSLPGTRDQKAGRDEISAMIILQDYLDSHGEDF